VGEEESELFEVEVDLEGVDVTNGLEEELVGILGGGG